MDDTHYVEEIDLLKILDVIKKNILLFLYARCSFNGYNSRYILIPLS